MNGVFFHSSTLRQVRLRLLFFCFIFFVFLPLLLSTQSEVQLRVLTGGPQDREPVEPVRVQYEGEFFAF